jgi:uncharacterized cupredoxin-like copper-binding protein
MSAGLTSVAGAQGLSADESPSAAHTAGPRPSEQASTPAETVVEVQAFDLGFTPTSIELRAPGTTRIVLQNIGRVPHNLTVDALGIQVVAPRGLTSDATLIDPPPGSYQFYCSISGHKEGGMVGTFVVQESAPVMPTGAPSPGPTLDGPTASG